MEYYFTQSTTPQARRHNDNMLLAMAATEIYKKKPGPKHPHPTPEFIDAVIKAVEAGEIIFVVYPETRDVDIHEICFT